MQEINVRKLNTMLEYASAIKASDVHIAVGGPPCVRVNSVIQPIQGTEVITPDIARELVEESLDEKRRLVLEANGEVDYAFSIAGFGRYRMNVFKQRGTYSMAIRSQPFIIPPFDTLGLPQIIKTFTNKSKGLVLVTGPTGSGKSTTLASMIDIINKERQANIITIEDPIEYLHKHNRSLVSQREVGLDTLNFTTALRSSLREDPDVILVGEMRDAETTSIALTAAETGHLVFSTLHTNGAAKTIDRIVDVFPTGQQNQIRSQLATALEGVVTQQLIPRKDGKGVVAACEIMVVNPAIRNLIREGKPFQINSVIQTGSSLGMQSMAASLAKLVLSGVITQEEALNRVQETQLLLQMINRG